MVGTLRDDSPTRGRIRVVIDTLAQHPDGMVMKELRKETGFESNDISNVILCKDVRNKIFSTRVSHGKNKYSLKSIKDKGVLSGTTKDVLKAIYKAGKPIGINMLCKMFPDIARAHLLSTLGNAYIRHELVREKELNLYVYKLSDRGLSVIGVEIPEYELDISVLFGFYKNTVARCSEIYC